MMGMPPGSSAPVRGLAQRLLPPPGVTADRLPEPDAPGAHLLAHYCAPCHDLPSPGYRTAAEWPDILDRMLTRARLSPDAGMGPGSMMGQGSGGSVRRERAAVPIPTAAEAAELLTYLRHFALLPADPRELAAAPPQGRAAFVGYCSACHALPSPRMHRAEDWPLVVARMEVLLVAVRSPGMGATDQQDIARLLTRLAASAAPP